MNLGPPSGAASSTRPHQWGRVLGKKRGKWGLGKKRGSPLAVRVEWLIDTGADVSALRQSVGRAFDVTSTGLSANPTTGGGGIQIVGGMTAEFEVEDALGTPTIVHATKHIGIKSTDGGSNVLGMEHVAEVNATVDWDPVTSRGALRV